MNSNPTFVVNLTPDGGSLDVKDLWTYTVTDEATGGVLATKQSPLERPLPVDVDVPASKGLADRDPAGNVRLVRAFEVFGTKAGV